MQILSFKRNLFLLSFFITGIAFSQDRPLGGETVIVVKPYTPSVNDAFKIKETPRLGDSVTLEKKPVKYSIFSVPVASTFTPSKGQATQVEKAKRVKLYNNYATLGFGTYSNALAEFYSNMEVGRSDNFGVYLTHNSSQGGIKNVELDDSFYNTELNLNYNSRNRNNSWNTELELGHKLFNWYGLPQIGLPATVVSNIDPQQNYFTASLGGELDFYDSFFERASARYRYFGDAYESTEHRVKADAFFEVNIAGELINTAITGDYVSGSFDRNYNMGAGSGRDYSFFIAGIAPSLLILRDDLTVNLGVGLFYSLNTQNSKNSIYLYPQVTASYRLGGDYFTPYAGLEGKLIQNSYYQFVEENPYVSPTLNIQPTDRPYDAYIGAKGRLTNSISYNFRGSYMSEFNKALFVANPYDPADGTTRNYEYGNSFGVVYDDVSTISAYGELNIDVRRNFRLGINGAVFSYSEDNEEEAWNLPGYTASVRADYQITPKWFAGANLFAVGERKDRETMLAPFGGVTNVVVTLDGFIDLNANLGYRFNDQLSVFARGNNLLGNNYERWSNFPVQGIQALLGATYKFDW